MHKSLVELSLIVAASVAGVVHFFPCLLFMHVILPVMSDEIKNSKAEHWNLTE